MGCASDKSIIGWLCSLKVLEARKRFDSSAMGEEDGHISSGMNEGNLSLLFFPQLNKKSYREAHVRSCTERLVLWWEFKAREAGSLCDRQFALHHRLQPIRICTDDLVQRERPLEHPAKFQRPVAVR